MNRTILYKLHLWLSLPLGIFVTLICLSGATLVFKNEIRQALGMPRVVAPHGGHHAADKDAPHASATKRIVGIDGTTSRHAHSSQSAVPSHSAEKVGPTTTKRDFFSYVTRFHTSFMMGKVGKWVVTYTTLLFVFILVSGMAVCWPRSRSQWRQRLKVARGKGRRRLFYDLHVSLGYWVVLWLVLLAVTGAAFGLHLLPRGSAAIKVFHELHVGAWGGVVTKIITFVVSLIGASLPLTGYYLYYKKYR